MKLDENTLLAQELARTLIQFRRLEWQQDSCQGMRQSEFILLATIIHCNGHNSKGVKASDLSTRLQITPAGATHMINSLEEGGYVERMADSSDRRVVLVRPTTRGKHFFQSMNERFLGKLKDLIDFLGEQDSKELLRLLSLTFTYIKERRNHDHSDKSKT